MEDEQLFEAVKCRELLYATNLLSYRNVVENQTAGCRIELGILVCAALRI